MPDLSVAALAAGTSTPQPSGRADAAPRRNADRAASADGGPGRHEVPARRVADDRRDAAGDSAARSDAAQPRPAARGPSAEGPSAATETGEGGATVRAGKLTGVGGREAADAAEGGFAALLAAQLEPAEVVEMVPAVAPGADGGAPVLLQPPPVLLAEGAVSPPAGKSLPPAGLLRATAQQAGAVADGGGAPVATDAPAPEAMPSNAAAVRGEMALSGGEDGVDLVSEQPRAASQAVERLAGGAEAAPRVAAESGEAARAPALPAAAATPTVEPGAAAASRAAQPVEVPFGQPRWAESFGERVSWLVRDGAQVASLRLDPPQLGPVEIRVSLSNGEATLSFVSPHPQVREAIEAAMPRLREMLGDQGLALGNVDVSGREPREEGRAGAAGGDGIARGAGGIEEEEAAPASVAMHRREGLLDHYA